MGNRQRLKESLGTLGVPLGPGADRTCRHKLLQVPTSRGPPEPTAQQGESVVDSRVAGQGGQMSPLQDLRACVLRHVHPVGGCVLWWCLIPQGPLDPVLDLQPGGSDQGPSREYGFRGLCLRRWRVEPGQGIRLAVPRTGAVRPPGLSGVEALRRPEVLQVTMVRPDEEWNRCTHQQVVPFLQHQHQGQQFLIPHGIISLCRG